MLLRVCCLVTLAGLLMQPLPAWTAAQEVAKPAPVKHEPVKDQDKGFFQAPESFTQPDWALTPAGYRPGFDKKDSMASFAYPGSDSSQTYTCAVAATAAKLGISADSLKNYMIQQANYQAAVQQYQQYQQQQAMMQMMQSAMRSQQQQQFSANMRSTMPAMVGVSARMGFPGGDCFVSGTPIQLGSETATLTRAIEQVTVGARLSVDTSAQASAIDPKNYRRVELQALQTNGRRTDVSLLRSLSWLDENQIKVGTAVTLSVPGYGVETLFAVRAIEACPTLQAGQGPVVTGTFRHESASVVDLFIDGQVESIGSTAGHRYFSVDRQQFVAANRLKTGEQLSTPNGNVTVLRVVARPIAEPVYNLEVQGQAALRVGPAAVNAQSVGK